MTRRRTTTSSFLSPKSTRFNNQVFVIWERKSACKRLLGTNQLEGRCGCIAVHAEDRRERLIIADLTRFPNVEEPTWKQKSFDSNPPGVRVGIPSPDFHTNLDQVKDTTVATAFQHLHACMQIPKHSAESFLSSRSTKFDKQVFVRR